MMAIFDLHRELNEFYEQHVRLGLDQRKKLAEYRDACLDRLKQGLKKLGDERNTTYKVFTRSIGQGSYPMHTLNQHVHDEYDIDVAVVFKKDDLPAAALDARRRVADALLATGGNFKKEPEARTNAVTVWYADGAHVDLAVYREEEKFFGTVLVHAGPDWQDRDPEAVTSWFQNEVEVRSPGSFFSSVDSKQLRRVVRWVKAFARSRVSWSLPGGMIITALVAEVYQSDGARDDVALFNTVSALTDRLKFNLDVNNPAAPDKSLTSKPAIKAQMKLLLEKLELIEPKLAVLAEESCTRERALQAWAKFFNHRYWGDVVEEGPPAATAKAAGVSEIEIAVAIAKAKGRPVTPVLGDRPLPKRKWLRFSVPQNWQRDGVTFRWIVTNTGDEANAANDMGHDRVEGPEIWRSTAYKGVHTMTCEARQGDKVIGKGVRQVRVSAW
jgi:hypothetical protein